MYIDANTQNNTDYCVTITYNHLNIFVYLKDRLVLPSCSWSDLKILDHICIGWERVGVGIDRSREGIGAGRGRVGLGREEDGAHEGAFG